MEDEWRISSNKVRFFFQSKLTKTFCLILLQHLFFMNFLFYLFFRFKSEINKNFEALREIFSSRKAKAV